MAAMVSVADFASSRAAERALLVREPIHKHLNKDSQEMIMEDEPLVVVESMPIMDNIKKCSNRKTKVKQVMILILNMVSEAMQLDGLVKRVIPKT